ncbi:hypothetical protein [Actinomycetospora lemnae]|uniref:Uncharacterized protein n=1 Tax=Actinomycetospora lemnae TaxID=3019891 RepID=A0ABT5SUQ8_9PSEU|nr:hypothetical protein [Actinomycetospora sp. DW7H6]MDD7965478.1 hypothetical protein [Actinomycetospora sp. DW7H6]
MPEYLTPGVYVEETSFRSRPVQGVPTATFGMAGRTEYGPVPYNLPGDRLSMLPEPTLVTSITEYERAFGGLLVDGTTCRLAHAARAFFANGGRRLYVSRVFAPTMTTGANPQLDVAATFASLPIPARGTPMAVWRARWPGVAGRRIQVATGFRRSGNVIVGGSSAVFARGRRWRCCRPRRPAPTTGRCRWHRPSGWWAGTSRGRWASSGQAAPSPRCPPTCRGSTSRSR